MSIMILKNHRFQEKADRLSVADVSGDWCEELIVINGNQLRIYNNPKPNPNRDRPRLWFQNHYRRSKMTWNYYSPYKKFYLKYIIYKPK
ncbi:MAG: hypothetical protein QNJ63_01100 [Calothrix sp. MO_192.B10]|nr:hypothetical protein [Calothrix sp. MO_192.B10]